jgi:hypothetical protein
MGLRMSSDVEKWSEIVSVALVYIQETCDELLLLQMNENNIKNYFTQMYFDISREDETDETKALLERINMFRENNRRLFTSTLDFLIAPLHLQVEILNSTMDKPSKEAKKKLLNALNVQSRTELFVRNLYTQELEIISEYLSHKEKQLQAFKVEKLKAERKLRTTDENKLDNLRNELSSIKF